MSIDQQSQVADFRQIGIHDPGIGQLQLDIHARQDCIDKGAFNMAAQCHPAVQGQIVEHRRHGSRNKAEIGVQRFQATAQLEIQQGLDSSVFCLIDSLPIELQNQSLQGQGGPVKVQLYLFG